MKTNHMSPVETDDSPGFNLGLNSRIGNVRWIKEGIGKELAVGNHPASHSHIRSSTQVRSRRRRRCTKTDSMVVATSGECHRREHDYE